MITHLLSSSTLLSGIVLLLLLAWLIGAAVMTVRVGKTAAGSAEEETHELVRRPRKPAQENHSVVGVEAIPLSAIEAPTGAQSVGGAALHNAEAEPPASIAVGRDAR
jgi:hypothetical protein